MNDELSSTNKKEVNNGSMIGGQEDQIDSIDERKKLLYDEHVINRQKAALNICKSIVDQVKQDFGYHDRPDETEKSAEESVSSDASSFATKKLVKVVRDSDGFQEKLEKIRGFVHEKHLESFSSALKTKKINHELIPGENEDAKSHDTSFHRLSRIKDKPVKEESLMVNGNLKELFGSESSMAFKGFIHSSSFQRLDGESYIQVLERIMDLSPKVKSQKYKKSFISINKQCISLPESSLDNRVISLLVTSFLHFKDLVKLDLSRNNLGDSPCAQLISTLTSSSPHLEHLDLSNTGSEVVTSENIGRMLNNPHSRLQTLRIDSNNLMDEGICCICVGLLNNISVKFVNFTNTGFELAGGLALAKVIRINRTLKGLALGNNKILGKPLREIARAMIVNNQIISLSVSDCFITDEDIKEFSHMLNSNSKLLQLDVSNNKITQRGLEHLKYGLSRNKSLFHLAISGNIALRLKTLEKFKASLSRCVLVDICKEEDFLRTNEAKKFKMIELLK
jgi:Ran GTPase-activating protein (RanGAP) involved in mRNA processing and transport